MDPCAGLGVGPPQLLAGEADTIDVLGILAEVVGVAVGEDAGRVDRDDGPELAPDIARQASVAGRAQVLGSHRLADVEARRAVDRTQHGRSGRRELEAAARLLKRRTASGIATCQRTAAPGELFAVDDAVLDHQGLEGAQPAPVVAGAQILDRGQSLDRVAHLVDVADTRTQHQAEHGVHPSLPAVVEARLVLLDLDAAEAVHAAEIVDAVHRMRRKQSSSRPIPREAMERHTRWLSPDQRTASFLQLHDTRAYRSYWDVCTRDYLP